jgi:hypothetical protein
LHTPPRAIIGRLIAGCRVRIDMLAFAVCETDTMTKRGAYGQRTLALMAEAPLLRAQGMTLQAISAQFGVSFGRVAQVL